MAQQKGIIKLKGTIGDITFYKSGDTYMAREKGGIDAKRIATDPNFQRTRENGAEFGTAGKAGKLLRTAFRALAVNAKDRYLAARLTRDFIKVLQLDMTNPRGKRNVIDGEAELLRGFEFNEQDKLSTTLFAPATYTINRVTGVLETVFAAYVPANVISAPGGTTHYKIVSAGAVIDFENASYTVDTAESNILPLNNVATAALTLTNNVTAASVPPLFLAVGIEFYQEVNGNQYPLKNGAYNALCIVKVDGGV